MIFEIGDIVAYREWSWTYCQFHPDKWVVVDRDHIHLQYDDYVWEYTIQNQETDEVITNVTDTQIKNFYD